MTIGHILIGLIILFLVYRRFENRAYHHPENEGAQTLKRFAGGVLTVAFYAYMVCVLPVVASRFKPPRFDDDVPSDAELSIADQDFQRSSSDTDPSRDKERDLTEYLFPPLPSWSDKH